MAAYDSVEQARTLQFKANVTHLYQQAGKAKLRGTFREETLQGKAHFFERLGLEEAVDKTARHADTVLLDPAHSRRMVVPTDKVWNALVDQQDKIRMLIDPNSEYAIAAASALNRAMDRAYITAFAADAAAGESGASAVTFASEAGGDVDVSAGVATTAQILAIKKALDDGDVTPEERFIVYKPALVTQLLGASSAPLAASSDYNTVKALVRGELDTWIGFKWIMSTLLPQAAGNDYYCFAWQKDAMGAAFNKEIMARLSERADKDYAIQTYACMTMGATRVQGAGVYRLRIDASL